MGCPFHNDPFGKARREEGVVKTEFQGKEVAMILRYKEVRKAAKDWKTFSSDAPLRVPIPSEENVRKVRQLPIETDPPEHTDYRKLVEPFFRRPRQSEVIAAMESLVTGMIEEAMSADSVEIVREFGLPLVSRALALMLNVPPSEAEIWISWGTHVFRDGADQSAKGSQLDQYIENKLDEVAKNPGEDFFSALTQVEYKGRRLTRDEMLGFANLTFAGGRDTMINSVASIFHYFGTHPNKLEWMRTHPEALNTAIEEFVRVVSPLSHIGRVCPVETQVGPQTVSPDERISLNFASANMDETVFKNPEEIQLDRKPNPHVGFGSGPHTCLGAHQARLVLRTLLNYLTRKVDRIDILEARENEEKIAQFSRSTGFEKLILKLQNRS